VTTHILELSLANLLMLVVGIGLLPVLRLGSTPRSVVLQLPLAYAVGLAATGVVGANLALIDVPIGRVGLPLLAVAALALGSRRLERRRPPDRRPRALLQLVPAAAVLVVVGAYLGNAARLLAVKPLVENDSWALWGLRTRALYDFGHPIAPIFTNAMYPSLQYPLFVPALEAIDCRFMGAYDGTVLHLQQLGLAIAFFGGLWSLLHRRVPPLLLACALLAIVTAPSFFSQLQSNEADIPVAMMVALGVAALAAWLRAPEPGLLPAAVLFLTAGALTKNEGEVFVLAAFVAAFAVARRAQFRPLGAAALVTVALVLPWHLWLLAHHVTATKFALSRLLHPHYLTSHWYRVVSAQHQLIAHIQLGSSWGRLTLTAAAGVGVALVFRNLRIAAFATSWLLLCFGGLLLVYWASPLSLQPDLSYSADRTIDTLVIGAVTLVSLLVSSPQPAPASAASGEAGSSTSHQRALEQ
jgi:hypothetical protein